MTMTRGRSGAAARMMITAAVGSAIRRATRKQDARAADRVAEATMTMTIAAAAHEAATVAAPRATTMMMTIAAAGRAATIKEAGSATPKAMRKRAGRVAELGAE